MVNLEVAYTAKMGIGPGLSGIKRVAVRPSTTMHEFIELFSSSIEEKLNRDNGPLGENLVDEISITGLTILV